MKTAAIFAIIALGLTTASGQNMPLPGFYFGLDAGANLIQDAEVEELFGPVAPGTDIEFDPGFRLGMEVGCDLTDWLTTELELAFTYNEIKSISGTYEADAGLLMVPMYLNLRLHLPSKQVWVSPFIGAGVGGAAMNLSVDEIGYEERYLWGDSSGVCFSAQGLAGVQFYLSETSSLSLEYRYVYLFSPEMEIDSGSYWNIMSDEVRFGDLQSHMFSIAYQFRF